MTASAALHDSMTPPSSIAFAGNGNVETTLPPFESFDHACRAVLARLRADTSLALWAFTRTDGNDWILLAVDDDNYGIKAGSHLPWSESICARMTAGRGPQAAPDLLEEPQYRDAPLLKRAQIRSYVGVPLQRSDGSLFGTLCGFDPAPRGPELAQHLPQVRLHARLLGTLLEHDLELLEIRRRAERAEVDSLADPLTGTYNRRGWMRLLKAEEARCRRYGHGVGVLMADLDNLKHINDEQGHDFGDALLTRAARALASVVRDGDAVARIGGDEFAVLAVGVGRPELAHLCERAARALRDADVEATLGTGMRDGEHSLAQAYRAADLAMLEAKRVKRGARRIDDDNPS